MSLEKLRKVTESLQALPPLGDTDFGAGYKKVAMYAARQIANIAYKNVVRMVDAAELHAFPKGSNESRAERRRDMALYFVADLKRLIEDRF
jgi:hypothetical protein